MAFVRHGDDGYKEFRASVAQRVGELRGPLFTTDANPSLLVDAFLGNLPYDRQYYTCHACMDFINRYGGLVYIAESGAQAAALWWSLYAPAYFLESVLALNEVVWKASVTGVFVSSRKTWGEPVTPPWTHLYGQPQKGLVYSKGGVLTAGQKAAEYQEDYRLLQSALHENDEGLLEEAMRFFGQGQLSHAEKFLAHARWLLELHQSMARKGIGVKRNLVWRAVATAPAGYCHVKATVLGSVLEDLRNGLAFGDLRARYEEKLHPLRYQRPTTLKEGNIKQAEEVIATLGLASALQRRFARREDLICFWEPTAPAPSPRGDTVFGHLTPTAKPGQRRALQLPSRTMTWVKFEREVLPRAQTLEAQAPVVGDYCALVAPAASTGASILKWSNGISWYVYHKGSQAVRWNLSPDVWVPVTGLCEHPAQWSYGPDSPRRPEPDRIFVLLKGCRDLKYAKGGGLFPEQIRSDLHHIRQTLEAHAAQAVIQGKEDATACGLMEEKDARWDLRLRVNGEDTYIIDRWD